MKGIYFCAALLLTLTSIVVSHNIPLPPECQVNTGHLPHEYDCSFFYKCDQGKKVRFNCPPPLHFNTALQNCDWPENAGCISRPGPPAEPANTQAQPPTNPVKTYPVHPVESPPHPVHPYPVYPNEPPILPVHQYPLYLIESPTHLMHPPLPYPGYRSLYLYPQYPVSSHQIRPVYVDSKIKPVQAEAPMAPEVPQAPKVPGTPVPTEAPVPTEYPDLYD